MDPHQPSSTPGATPRKSRRRKLILWAGSIVAIIMIALVFFLRSSLEPRRPLAQLNLADGRILQIEGVTYGTKHRIGQSSILIDRFGQWMPNKLRTWLTPKVP